MRTRTRHNSTSRRGAAVVELAVTAPFLILIVLGAIDVGQYINVTLNVSDASREGARQASRHQAVAVADVVTEVRSYLGSSASIAATDVQVAVMDGSGNTISDTALAAIPSGQPVSVQVSVPFAAVRWMPFFNFLDTSVASSTTRMRRE